MAVAILKLHAMSLLLQQAAHVGTLYKILHLRTQQRRLGEQPQQ